MLIRIDSYTGLDCSLTKNLWAQTELWGNTDPNHVVKQCTYPQPGENTSYPYRCTGLYTANYPLQGDFDYIEANCKAPIPYNAWDTLNCDMANLHKNLSLPAPVRDPETDTCQFWTVENQLPQISHPNSWEGVDALLTSQCSGKKGTGADPDVHYLMFPNAVGCQDMKGLVNKTGITGEAHVTTCNTETNRAFVSAFTTRDCHGDFPMPGSSEYWYNMTVPACGEDAGEGNYTRLEWCGRGW
jgi:hypothetical protein